MASVLLLGCPDGYVASLPQGSHAIVASDLGDPRALDKPDLVVIGPASPMASVLAQRVGRTYPGVDLVIAAPPSEVPRLKDLLRISPYVPLRTELVSSEPTELLEKAIRGAVVRCELRKGHRAVLDSVRQFVWTAPANTASAASARPSAAATPDMERQRLLGFYRFYQQVRSEVLRDLELAMPAMMATTPFVNAANATENDQVMARLERAAVLEEAWEPYVEKLHAAGRTHAELGHGFAQWLELSYHFRRSFMERFARTNGVDGATSTDVLLGMESFLRITVSEIERAYAETHDALLQRHEANARLFTVAVESSDTAILTASLDGIITAHNPAAEHLLGYGGGEALGRPLSDLTREDLRGAVAACLAEAARGVPKRGFETVWRTEQGQELDMSLTVSPVKATDGRAVALSIVAHDITKQKQSEESLRQTQKMEAVGRLAGGIAHDFNNLLTVIIAHASLRSSDCPPYEAETEAFSEILKAAERASALTQQLLTFSRGHPVEPTRIDAGEVVRSTHRLLRRTLSEDIEIVVRVEEGLWQVWIDQSQIEQLFMNLALNARDAMPAGGKLVIDLENETLPEPDGALLPGDYVRLRVCDTGVGMVPEVLSHVFEPFFTTKPLGHGTGLGLATCHAIARRAGGDIRVASEPGRSSTFSVWLPRAAQDETRSSPAIPAPAPASLSGTETILVVEDDRAVRAAATLALEQHGYSVLQACNGDEALRVIERNPDIALALTDVVMPQMGGPELATRLGRRHPQLPVLFMSGYAEQGVLTGDVLSRNGLIFKPFLPGDLARRVRQMLDERVLR